MEWNKLESEEDLSQLIVVSAITPVLIFKHSVRCGTSSMALSRLERMWKEGDSEKLAPYLLDLIAHRDVSNEIASRFGIEHESPQVLIIKNGECIYSESHSGINYGEILNVLK